MRRQRRWRDVATRSVLDAAKATLIGVICFGLLVGVSTQFRAIRVQAPWAVDPYDAVASLAMMMVPIVAVITGLRCVRWRREVAYPSFALVEILRGCGVALVAIVATDVVYVAAVIRVGFPSDTQWRPLLLGLLLVSTASVVGACMGWLRVWSSQRRVLGHGSRDVLEGRPDAVDDVAGLLRTPPATFDRLRPMLARTADLLASWAESSVSSPRRHPWLFVAAVSCAAGVAMAASEFVHEGFPPSVMLGIVVIVLFAAIVGGAGLLGYAVLGRYLHLVRPPHDRGATPDARPT